MKLHYIIMGVFLVCNIYTPLHSATSIYSDPRCLKCGQAHTLRHPLEDDVMYPPNPIILMYVNDKHGLYTDFGRLIFNQKENVNKALINYHRNLHIKSGVLDISTEQIQFDDEIDHSQRNTMQEYGQKLDGITPLIYCAIARKPSDALCHRMGEKEYRDVLRDVLKRGKNPFTQARVYNVSLREDKKTNIEIKESQERASTMVYDPPALCMLYTAEKRWEEYPAIEVLLCNALNAGKGVSGIVTDYCVGDSVELDYNQEEFVNKVVESRGYSKQFVLNKLAQAKADDTKEEAKEAKPIILVPVPAKKPTLPLQKVMPQSKKNKCLIS